MNKAISIDPGISKCGIIVADIKQQKVFKAEVIESDSLLSYVKKLYKSDPNHHLLIGNGTSSKKYIRELRELIPNLIIADEKDSTYRAKERYFDIFPIKGLKHFLPREIFILNKNLDALAALIIMEDYFECKFEISSLINVKTWLK